jgi:hypothetical protein
VTVRANSGVQSDSDGSCVSHFCTSIEEHFRNWRFPTLVELQPEKRQRSLDALELLPKASGCFWGGPQEILGAVSEDLLGGKRKQKPRSWEHDPIVLLETKGGRESYAEKSKAVT